MMIKCWFFLTVFSFCMLLGCKTDQNSSVKNYLFVSHTYQWGVADNNRIDYRFEGFDFSIYDQIWLGGDLCARTSEKRSTIEYLDSIFDLVSNKTKWAIGNHDMVEGHLKFITDKTQRKSFYASFFDGIGTVVLNTTEFCHPNYTPKDHECALLDGQINLLQNIADTIKDASHLIILHHHSLLNNNIAHDSMNFSKIFNYYHPEYFVSCEHPATFEEVIFPILKRIQEKGVQVILVGGDLGQRAKEFEFRTKEGIYFLASGINNSAIPFGLPEYVTNTDPDKLLLFKHDPTKKELSWKFIELEKLIEANKKSSVE